MNRIKNNKEKIFVFAVLYYLLSISCFLNAQEAVQSGHEIKVLARYNNNMVMLRWAVTTPSAWMKATKYGYNIVRYTVKKNGALEPSPLEKKTIVTALTPKPLEDWEEIINSNDYAAILAQALYGESFQVEQVRGGLADIVNKSKEINQRFSFSLYAADMSFEAAKMAGLGFEDTTVLSDEEYLYTIETLVPKESIIINPGSVSIQPSKSEPLPKPIDLYAVPNDKSVLLTWEYKMFKSIFTSYYLERSSNGKDFKRLGDTPLVNLNDKPGSPANRMFYVDTLSNNTQKYYYRVQGISPFGELSPFSEVVSAQGIKKLTTVPHISDYDFDSVGNINLSWEFAKTSENEITRFELNWASQEKGPYKLVESDISVTSRKTTFKEVEASNYFKISAIGKNNQKTTSLPVFVQTIDSIPPSAPIGVTGVIDTLGIVQLEWKQNTENDVLGYRVFRGNLEKEEVAQLTVSPIKNTNFIDTVNIRSLNSKVFYQIVAVDKRYNMSEYSEKIALKKPDVIPPSSPIFSSYKVKKDGIELHWINSSSDDVFLHQLYRQDVENSQKGWKLVFKTADTTSTYLDKGLKSNTKYRYAIFAEDDSQLRSLPSTPVTVTYQNRVREDIVKGFTAIADRVNKNITVSWRKMPEEVSEIVIYKSKKGEHPVLWKQIPNTISKIVDTSVSPGNIYLYQIKVMTKTGKHSQIKYNEVNY
ncbi:fibronectin type III domain-containing protein [Aquimarina algicola]|uniref:Fibronectin type III domain-containing protein n=1 Tax=Aquimarina algicola TaxID=2589995 RepID=A0A504JLI2_9FLAO|nr:fibronectin type III domain-containing protein [Aquimarina algicola]TPN89245.1 fibronectin type III domain-containing protein [Aquimarina algicola]